MSSLPAASGVYWFEEDGSVIYVGKAKNIRKRVRAHMSTPWYRLAFGGVHPVIGYELCPSEDLDVLERDTIKRLHPELNRTLGPLIINMSFEDAVKKVLRVDQRFAAKAIGGIERRVNGGKP